MTKLIQLMAERRFNTFDTCFVTPLVFLCIIHNEWGYAILAGVIGAILSSIIENW